MITNFQISEIISLYKKHGWNISRVLLSAELKSSIDTEDVKTLFDDAKVFDSEIDAVWFSRNSNNDKVAWELRHLNSNPFAVIEFIDKDAEESAQHEILNNLETRLKEHASKQK